MQSEPGQKQVIYNIDLQLPCGQLTSEWMGPVLLMMQQQQQQHVSCKNSGKAFLFFLGNHLTLLQLNPS